MTHFVRRLAVSAFGGSIGFPHFKNGDFSAFYLKNVLFFIKIGVFEAFLMLFFLFCLF